MERIEKILFNKNNIFTTTKITYKNYLSENDNAKKIYSEMEKYDRTLLISPTGSGKTYTILKELCELDKNTIHLFFTPKVAQSQQNNNDYQAQCITSGTNIDYFIHIDKRLKKFVSKKNKYSLVFDKANELIDIFEQINCTSQNNIVSKNDLKFKVYIDEAHTLISSYNYRGHAIRTLLNFIDRVNAKVLFTTATADSLLNIPELKIDRVILAQKENFKSNVSKIEIIHNLTNNDYYDFAFKLMLKDLKSGHKIFFRLNNKDNTEKILDAFNKKTISKGHKAKTIYVNADEKEYDKESKKYKNKMYHAVIKEDRLINGYDVYATTSLFDEGVSIKQAPKDTVLYFLIDNVFNMNVDNIIQFSNRFRFKVSKMVIVVNSNMPYIEKNEFDSYENYQHNLITLNKVKLDSWENSDLDISELDILINGINAKEQYGEPKNCIRIIDKSFLEIDMFKIYYIAYSNYQQQYYYNLNKLRAFLINELHTYITLEEKTFIESEEVNLKFERESNEIIFKRVKEGIPKLQNKDTEYLFEILFKNEKNKTQNRVKNAKTESDIVNDLLSLERLTTALKTGYALRLDLKEMLIKISESEKQADFEKYVIIESIKYHRDLFKKSNYNFNVVKPSNIMYIILKECFSISTLTNKMKKKIITDEEISNISKNLKISKKQTIEYIKVIFNYEYIEKEKKFILRDIKTE